MPFSKNYTNHYEYLTSFGGLIKLLSISLSYDRTIERATYSGMFVLPLQDKDEPSEKRMV